MKSRHDLHLGLDHHAQRHWIHEIHRNAYQRSFLHVLCLFYQNLLTLLLYLHSLCRLLGLLGPYLQKIYHFHLHLCLRISLKLRLWLFYLKCRDSTRRSKSSIFCDSPGILTFLSIFSLIPRCIKMIPWGCGYSLIDLYYSFLAIPKISNYSLWFILCAILYHPSSLQRELHFLFQVYLYSYIIFIIY